MFGLVLVVIVSLLVLLLLMRWLKSRSSEEIFRLPRASKPLPFKNDPKLFGDAVGDAFLQKHGALYVYECEELAKELGLRDVPLPHWLDLDLVKEGLAFQQTWMYEVMGAGLGAIVES